jgi:hypothetical protein
MAVDKAAIGKFMDLRKQGYDRCMYLDFKCERDAIRAHSVQNGKVLDLLQKDNHVIIPQPKFDPTAGPSFELGLVGRNKALTFTGLCSEHDTGLFKLADTLPLDINNKKQLEQYGYRAVMKELHTCIEEGTRFYALDADQIKKGLVKPGEGGAGYMAIIFSDRAWRLFRYRSQNFDIPILEGKDLPIEHRIITLSGQKPTIAVSSFFGVGSEKNGDTIGVMLSVVPESEKTTAVLSYATAQKDAVTKALPDLFDDRADPERALSHTVLQRVENFTLAPAYYDGWSADKKRKVVEYFNVSLLSGKPPPEDAEFSLFTSNSTAASTSYLKSLVDQMSNLTVSEATALSKLLHEKWKVLP